MHAPSLSSSFLCHILHLVFSSVLPLLCVSVATIACLLRRKHVPFLTLSSCQQMTFEDVLQSDGSFRDVRVDQSTVMRDLLESSATLCLEQGNATACNALGNLCVLQMHAETAPPCTLYRELVELRNVSKTCTFTPPSSSPYFLLLLHLPPSTCKARLAFLSLRPRTHLPNLPRLPPHFHKLCLAG